MITAVVCYVVTVSNLVAFCVAAALANFTWALFTRDWEAAAERSFFQVLGVVIFWFHYLH